MDQRSVIGISDHRFGKDVLRLPKSQRPQQNFYTWAPLQHHAQNEAVVPRFERSSSPSRTILLHSKWWSSSASCCGKVVCCRTWTARHTRQRSGGMSGLTGFPTPDNITLLL